MRGHVPKMIMMMMTIVLGKGILVPYTTAIDVFQYPFLLSKFHMEAESITAKSNEMTFDPILLMPLNSVCSFPLSRDSPA